MTKENITNELFNTPLKEYIKKYYHYGIISASYDFHTESVVFDYGYVYSGDITTTKERENIIGFNRISL